MFTFMLIRFAKHCVASVHSFTTRVAMPSSSVSVANAIMFTAELIFREGAAYCWYNSHAKSLLTIVS